MHISREANEIIEESRLMHDVENIRKLIEKHGVDAAAEAIVVLGYANLSSPQNVAYRPKPK